MDPIEAAKGSVTLVGELMKAAGDNPQVKEAGTNLGKAAVTITKTINNALLPLAAVNFAFDKARKYFAERFEADLHEKAARIPPEALIEPKASIAGPALQGLAFAHEEPPLKEMFLNLLTSAMDDSAAPSVHPAFVEIVKQLSSEEATWLKKFLGSGSSFAIAEVRVKDRNNSSFTRLFTHLWNFKRDGIMVKVPRGPALVDNWVRLGLVEVDYATFGYGPNDYDWVEKRPEFIRLYAAHTSTEKEVVFEKGLLIVTALGKQFASMVGL